MTAEDENPAATTASTVAQTAGSPTLAASALPPGIAFSLPQLQLQQVQVWQGQFPPPEAIERYEASLPGAFDRIVAMAERAQSAQIDLQSSALEATRSDTRRGHWFALVITLSSIVGAGLCAYIGQPWVAGALCGVPVLAVAKSFVDSVRAKPGQSTDGAT